MNAQILSVECVGRLKWLEAKLEDYEPPFYKDRLYRDHYLRMIKVRIDSDPESANMQQRGHIVDDVHMNPENLMKMQEGYIMDDGHLNPLNLVQQFQSMFPGVIQKITKEDILSLFSKEEAHGRFLNLHKLHTMFIHSTFGKTLNYSAYLEEFSKLENKPMTENKEKRKYKAYLKRLVDYMTGFVKRTRPLVDVNNLFEQSMLCQLEGRIDLKSCSSHTELVNLPPQKLTMALLCLKMKSGGTVDERAKRLFSTKHTPVTMLDRSHFSKRTGRGIYTLERELKILCAILNENILRTKRKYKQWEA